MSFPRDLSIEALEAAIQNQQLTVARLRAAGHEVTDADRELQRMMERMRLMLLHTKATRDQPTATSRYGWSNVVGEGVATLDLGSHAPAGG